MLSNINIHEAPNPLRLQAQRGRQQKGILHYKKVSFLGLSSDRDLRAQNDTQTNIFIWRYVKAITSFANIPLYFKSGGLNSQLQFGNAKSHYYIDSRDVSVTDWLGHSRSTALNSIDSIPGPPNRFRHKTSRQTNYSTRKRWT